MGLEVQFLWGELEGQFFLRQKSLGDKVSFSLLAFQLSLIVSISTSSAAALCGVFSHALALRGWDVGLR